VGVGLDVGVAVGAGVGVVVAAWVGVGVTLGTDGLAVGDALSAVVPPPGATVAGGIRSNSKNTKMANAAATPASRNTFKLLPSTS